MKQLATLLATFARQAQRRVSLEEALFSQRGFAYVWYRARFLFLRIPLGIGLHAAEVVAFSAAYDLGIIGRMLAIRSLPAVGAALWWGALEALRSRVRAAASQGEWGRAERAVRSFLALAVDVALIALLLAFVYVEFFPSEFGGFDIFDAYALGCSLRFGLELIARTYHAGVFAVRRVYRPTWSLILPDVFELALALALWTPLGPWGFSLSTLAAGLVNAWLQWFYSRAAYLEFGKFRPSLRRFGRTRKDIEPRDYLELTRHALANLASHIDAFLILLLTRAVDSGLPFVVLLHAGRPLFSAVGSYARVFYFDLLRLELGRSRFLNQRFARLVSRFATAVAAGAIGLAFLLQWLLFQGQLLADFALLALYTVARSTLAFEHMRLFTAGRYRTLATASVAVVITLLILRLTLHSERLLVAASVFTLALLALWFAYVNHRRARFQQPPAASASVGLLTWLHALANEQRPVQLGFALVDRHAGAPIDHVQRAIQTALPHTTIFCRAGRRHFVWHTSSSGAPTTDAYRTLLNATAGCLEQLQLSEPQSPAQALAAALRLEPFAHIASTQSAQPLTIADLRARFHTAFPNGSILDLTHAPTLDFLPTRAARHFVARSLLAACAGRPPPERRRDFPRVAVFCPQGEAEALFLVPPTANADQFRDFRDAVEQLAFQKTLASLSQHA
ncbi:MAG: hypothetical protein ACOY0T_38865 [Myxococcota bacterium]